MVIQLLPSHRKLSAVVLFGLLCLSSTVSAFAHLQAPRVLSPGVGKVVSIHRGGSSETELKSASTVFQAVDVFWKAQNPFVTAAIVAGTKATVADLFAQQRQKAKGTKFDYRRVLSFLVYGSLYQGCVQELIYNNLYNYLFGTATTAKVVVKKVMFDAVFHNAMVCIPMAYAVKSMIYRYSLKKGIQQYIDDVMHHGLLIKYYAIWMPVNAMIFTIVPPHWRIAVMATVSFFWMMILSTISSRKREST